METSGVPRRCADINHDYIALFRMPLRPFDTGPGGQDLGRNQPSAKVCNGTTVWGLTRGGAARIQALDDHPGRFVSRNKAGGAIQTRPCVPPLALRFSDFSLIPRDDHGAHGVD